MDAIEDLNDVDMVGDGVDGCVGCVGSSVGCVGGDDRNSCNVVGGDEDLVELC
ncbi:hypothetical protein ACKFKF_29760 [Phormidesmis sp. 146-12]